MMPKGKIKSSIGVEFTGDKINLVKLAKTAEGIVLVEARTVKSSVGRKEDDKKILLGNIVKTFEGLNFEKDEISLGVGGHASFVRRVKLPPVSHSKLRQIVSFEVQQQVPFSLSEVRWDYQVISPISKTPGPVIVLIAAIKQSFVEDSIKLLQESINRTPDIVDASSLALHNCLVFNDLLSKEKVSILINFGFSYTDMSIESRGEMAFTRAVPIGRRNILKKIAEVRKVELEKAEEILEKEDVSSIILPVWEDLIAEIKRTTNYYLSQIEKVTHFQDMYISGEFPKNSTIRELLNNSFRMETKEINPFNKIRYNPEVLANGVGNFCVSVGLALRALERSSVEINLLPYNILNKKKFASKRPYFIASCAVMFLIGWILLVSGARGYNFTNAKINMVTPILQSYAPYVSKIKELKVQRQDIVRRLQNIKDIFKQKSQLSALLLEISKITPLNIYITEISTVSTTDKTSIVASRTRRIGGATSSQNVEELDSAMTDEDSMSMEERIGAGPVSSRPVTAKVSAEINRQPSSKAISLVGIADSYPAVDKYIAQLQTSALFKAVELVSATSTLQTGETTQPRAAVQSRTPIDTRNRQTARMPSTGGTQEEQVQFTLAIELQTE